MEIRFSFEELEIQKSVRKFVKNDLLPISREVNEKWALDLSVNYANTKTHRGKSIGHRFQMTQVKLARMMSKIEAMRAYLFQVCSMVDQGKDVLFEAAALKLFVASEIKEITSDAMEIHGAYGLSNEYDVAGLYQAAISAQVVMGSLDIQRVIVAKGVLSRGISGV